MSLTCVDCQHEVRASFNFLRSSLSSQVNTGIYVKFQVNFTKSSQNWQNSDLCYTSNHLMGTLSPNFRIKTISGPITY